MPRRNKKETEENDEESGGRLGIDTKRSLVALAFLGLALLLMSYTVNVARVFDTFWNRFWI